MFEVEIRDLWDQYCWWLRETFYMLLLSLMWSPPSTAPFISTATRGTLLQHLSGTYSLRTPFFWDVLFKICTFNDWSKSLKISLLKTFPKPQVHHSIRADEIWRIWEAQKVQMNLFAIWYWEKNRETDGLVILSCIQHMYLLLDNVIPEITRLQNQAFPLTKRK